MVIRFLCGLRFCKVCGEVEFTGICCVGAYEIRKSFSISIDMIVITTAMVKKFIYRNSRSGLRLHVIAIAVVNRCKFVRLYLSLTTFDSDFQNISLQILKGNAKMIVLVFEIIAIVI